MWEKEIEKVLRSFQKQHQCELLKTEHRNENVFTKCSSDWRFKGGVCFNFNFDLKVVFVSSKTMEESFNRKVEIN